MMMDNEYELDFGEIIETLRTAEVVTVRFLTVSERLLIDNRHSEVDPPLVKLVPRVRSAEERFRSLKQLRPRFHLPEKITSISWPKHVHSLVDQGVWSAIVERIAEAGSPQAAQQCEEVLEELLRLEQKEVRNAILGEGYQSLWERNPS
jgi:hypothetical protein